MSTMTTTLLLVMWTLSPVFSGRIPTSSNLVSIAASSYSNNYTSISRSSRATSSATSHQMTPTPFTSNALIETRVPDSLFISPSTMTKDFIKSSKTSNPVTRSSSIPTLLSSFRSSDTSWRNASDLIGLNCTDPIWSNTTDPVETNSTNPLGPGTSDDLMQANSTESVNGSSGNLENVTCPDLSLLNTTQQWAAVNGDVVIQTFEEMYANNSIVCNACFGVMKGSCESKDPMCQNGLRDLATMSGGTPRWDTAAAHFAQDPDITDLKCELGSTECIAAPVCLSCNSPASFAILKSLSTMFDTLENLYSSLAEARNRATDQMKLFQTVFAPVPSIKDDAIVLGVVLGVVMGLIGIVQPEALTAFIGVKTGTAMAMVAVGAVGIAVGSSVAMDEFFFSQPGPPDVNAILGIIANETMDTYSRVTDALFANGYYTVASSDGKHATEVTMRGLMKNGDLLQAPGNKSSFFQNLVPSYERIIYQQLADYTWQYLQSDHVSHIPFIAFENKPCDQIGVEDPTTSSIAGIIDGVRKTDTNFTFDGACYYLLDAQPKGSPVMDQAPLFPHCKGTSPLPGGTNKDMTRNSEPFAGLNLGDFIIPSVKGWLRAHKQNGYPKASANGQMVSDPQDAAAVNIPIWDYLGSPEKPGVNCPKLNVKCARKTCDSWAPSTGTNQPGDYNPGWCGVHVIQYLRGEPNNINPLPSYQLDVAIFDDHGIQIGQATKQSAANVLKVVDGVLPYDFFVAPGSDDTQHVEFWYMDQFWNSMTGGAHQCKEGAFADGSRQIDCGFQCNEPVSSPLPSATIVHPLPNAPTNAPGGDKTFVNTFAPVTTAPAAAPTHPLPPAAPTSETGPCQLYIHQYQKDEPNINTSNNYEVEVYIFSTYKKHEKATVIGTSGKVPASAGRAITVNGLVSPLTVTAGETDNEPLVIGFQGSTFDTGSKQCDQRGFKHGGRDIYCHFTCQLIES